MNDKNEKTLEEAATHLVLRELTDMESGDIYGGAKPKWPKVTTGPVTPALE
ncbi:hypothetical protein [Xanthomonas fragariae]|uniref:hypothetical protein n=1 Tax=Xanthomonas fragariae TaxID=48664 RepID=UPI0022AB1044|nr:hypothetical protein [Xanthomonas fragariae]WAT14861.1 hypothetical protein OZ429_18360 [Xanthomonas fragariae]